MRWLILSHSNPAQLHAALECGRWSSPALHPDAVYSPGTEEEFADYQEVSRHFFCRWWGYAYEFKQSLLLAAEQPKDSGTHEALTLITTDAQLFCLPFDPVLAYNVLQDRQVLGVRLTVEPTPGAAHLREARWENGQCVAWTWQWQAVNGGLNRPFAYGTVYRTSDILGPLNRLDYATAEELDAAVNDDASLRRCGKIACLGGAHLVNRLFSHSDKNGGLLTNGHVPDVDALLSDGTSRWIRYKEEG